MGQAQLRAAKVLIVGAGGLGSPLALYLAAAGVGTIGLVDGDVLELSNLQRQIAHGMPNLARPKVASAAESMRRINPLVQVNTYNRRLDAANVTALVDGYDIICDGTDNFATRFLLADACVAARRTLVPRRCCASKASFPPSNRTLTLRAPATAASTRNRHPKGWCRAAPRPGCWAR